MKITSDYTLPIELEGKKDQNRKKLTKEQEAKLAEYNINRDWFISPNLDFSTSYAYSKKSQYVSKNTMQNIFLGGVFLAQDTSINFVSNNNVISNANITFSNNFAETVQSANVTFSKSFLNEKPLGIDYYSFGDSKSTGSPLLSNMGYGRGVYVSSIHNMDTNFDQTINLEGILLQGWEVELYLGDALLGYITEPKDGKYQFNDIPMQYGLNRFRLVFYSPFGETKEEIKEYLIGSTVVNKGELGYVVSAVQKDRYLFESKNRVNRDDEFFSKDISLYYGILDNLSLNTSYSSQNDPLNPKIEYDFYNAGFKYATSKFTIEYAAAFKAKYNGMANYLATSTSLGWLGSIYLEYQDFNELKSLQAYINDKYATNIFNARYNTALYAGSFTLPLYASYKITNYLPSDNFINLNEGNYSEQEFYFRTSYNLFSKYYLSVGDTYTIGNNNTKINEINYMLSTHYLSWGTRIELVQETLPVKYISQMNINVDYRLSNNKVYMYGNVQKNFMPHDNFTTQILNKDLVVYKIGSSYINKLGNFNASVATDGNRDFFFEVGYSISLGYNDTTKRIYKSDNHGGLSSSGNIAAIVFIDNNNNNLYDKNIDTPVQNATISNTGQGSSKTNENGIAYINSLSPYNLTNVSIDIRTLDDIMLESKVKMYDIYLRPGVTTSVLFPMVATSDVEGVVYYTVGNNIKTKKVMGNSIIVLMYEMGETIKKTKSDSDGTYLLERIPYGKYYIVVTPKIKMTKASYSGKVFIISESITEVLTTLST